jgi:hypothetical protein
MPTSEPQGCLSVLLRLIGLASGGGAAALQLPYRLRDEFLSKAELSFYRVLIGAVQGRWVVCPKVRLADLFYVSRPNENRGAGNSINQKHVDFLLCDPATLRPVVGVELDDSSHKSERGKARDALVDEIFAAAGLPLVHVPAARGYSPGAILELMEAAIAKR